MKRSVNLMLGDKVQVFARDSYYTVMGRKDGVRVEGIPTPLPIWEIFPIRITDEILRRNGFVQAEFGWNGFYLESDERALDIVRLETNCYEIFNGIEIHYVHELQHALRMLGLNEVADNFRIN